MRWAMVTVVLGLWGCASAELDEAGGAPSLSLLSALGIAQGLQHQADELELLGDVDGAVAHLEEVFEIPFPEGAEADREAMRLDAYGRIAELELSRGERASARTAIERGISEATSDSYFFARLLLARGRVEQAEARALRESGDEAGARAASLSAVTTLEESIAMNQRVLLSLANETESP